jgi:hypothetical protein
MEGFLCADCILIDDRRVYHFATGRAPMSEIIPMDVAIFVMRRDIGRSGGRSRDIGAGTRATGRTSRGRERTEDLMAGRVAYALLADDPT